MTTWPGQEIGRTTYRPQQADPYRIGPDPVLAARAQAEEERRRQDQIIQQQKAGIDAQAAAAAAAKAAREAAEWNATHNPDGSKRTNPDEPLSPDQRKAAAQRATLESIVGQINRVQQLYNSGIRDEELWNLFGAIDGIGPTAGRFNSAGQGLADQGVAAFRTPGQGSQSDYEARMFAQANTPSAGNWDAAIEEKLANVRRRVDANRAALGLPPAEWTGTDEQQGLTGAVSDDTPSPYDPGGPLNPQTPRGSAGGGSFLSNLGISTQNALAGAAQGVAGLYDLPMQAAQGIQRGINWGVGQGGGLLMDAVGLPGAADWWRQGASGVDVDIANRQSASGLIEQISPTPRGMGASRFAAQLVGGAMVPIGPKAVPRPTLPRNAAPMAPSVARDIISEGARNNVRVMTSDVLPPTTFTGKIARATGERIPYAGTGGTRAAQQQERAEAVRQFAREFGADAGGDLLQEVSDNFTATRGGKIAALSRQKNAIINRINETFVAPRTVQAVGEQARRLAGIDGERFAPVIRALQDFGNNLISGKTLQQIEGNRKLLGDLFEDPNLASIKGDGQKAINAIYAPLRDDMADFIGRTSGEQARIQWAKANEQLAGMAGELTDNIFRNVLRSSESTPENVARILFSQKPSEVRRLVGNLSPVGRARAQGAIIFRALEKGGGIDDISPDKFANEIARLGNSVGVVFDGADLARVNGLQRLLQATKQASVASAAPPTGVQSTPLVGGFAAGSVFGAGAIPFAVGAGMLARLYESAPVRNLLVGLGRAPAGSRQESKLLERILKIATSQTQIRGPAINDAFGQSPGALAAREQEQN